MLHSIFWVKELLREHNYTQIAQYIVRLVVWGKMGLWANQAKYKHRWLIYIIFFYKHRLYLRLQFGLFISYLFD